MESFKISSQNIKLTSLTLMLSFFAAFCHGQVNNSSDSITTNELSIFHDRNTNYDPLFYINGQLCQHLRKIYQDSKGNLWFGTNVYDIMKYDGVSLKYFTEFDGVNRGRITGIVEDSTGNIWFGTFQGLTKFDGKSFTTLTENDGLLTNEIWSLFIDKNGIFWIGTNKGLSCFDGNKFITITIPKAEVVDAKTIYSPDRITGIAEDKDGNLWFGTDGFGIYKYDNITFTSFTTENGLCDNTIYELMADSKGNLWIGTFWGGVCKYDGEKFTNFTKDSVITGTEVGGFFEDYNGDIWFAAENNGVYRYDGKEFTNLDSNQGLATNGVLSIYRDKESRFWFGGWGGLFRYDGKTFVSVTQEGPWAK